jgi:transcriptional regulator with XRE-family HTH domain
VVPVVERNAPLRPAAPTPVAKARVERGWSQREAARRIGVSHDVLRRAELGLGVYPPNAHRIALALDLDVFEVLTPSRKANGDPAAA